jgi:D-alanyl-D-alanine carboxypeptidase
MSIHARVSTIVLGSALVFAATATAPVVGSVAAAGGGPPACAYRDIVTPARSYGQYGTTLLDTIYKLPSGYAPRDLRSTGVSGGGLVRSLVVRDLQAMFAAARKAGAPLTIESSYRSYATQVSTFNHWVRVAGRTAALKASARPGHSEHQLGTVVDVTTYRGKSPWLYADWATTKAGAWMRHNAWTFGFVMSYPKGKSPSITCYKYEPWHFRYVGRATAKAIHVSGVTPREWVWLNPRGVHA